MSVVKDYIGTEGFYKILEVALKKDLKELISNGRTVEEIILVYNVLRTDDNDEINHEQVKDYIKMGKDGMEFLSLLNKSSMFKVNDWDNEYWYLLKSNYSTPIQLLAVFERYDKKDLDILLAENKDKTDLELISYLYDGKINLYNGEELVEMFRSFVNAFSRYNYRKDLWNSIYKLIDAYNDAFTYSPIIKERACPQHNKEKEQTRQEENSFESFVKEIQEQNKTSKLNI